MRTLPRRQSKSRNLRFSASCRCFPAARGIVLAQEVPGGAALALFVYIFLCDLYRLLHLCGDRYPGHRSKNRHREWLDGLDPRCQPRPVGRIAKKPIWWGLLSPVPFVNFVFMVLLWMAIAEAPR